MDEKLRILKMVEEGKISAEQAVSLLEAMGGPEESAGQESLPATELPDVLNTQNAAYEDKLLRIVVDTTTGDKVNVQLPVKIIRQLLKLTGKLPIQMEGMESIDMEALISSILECLDNESLGNIVDVADADGTTVRVFIG